MGKSLEETSLKNKSLIGKSLEDTSLISKFVAGDGDVVGGDVVGDDVVGKRGRWQGSYRRRRRW